MLTHRCHPLYQRVCSAKQVRVTAGTKPELVVLMDIPNVKAHRARLLYAAGLRTAEAVAGSSEATLMSILAKGVLAACPGLCSVWAVLA